MLKFKITKNIEVQPDTKSRNCYKSNFNIILILEISYIDLDSQVLFMILIFFSKNLPKVTNSLCRRIVCCGIAAK